MNRAIAVFCAAAVSAALQSSAAEAAAEFDPGEKALLRGIAAEVQGKMKGAVAIGDKAVTLLPVRGDRDSYMEGQLLGALVESGLAAVVSNDDKADERFRRILKEIRWDAAQTRLAGIDPATVDELGRLKSTQVLLEARLSLVRTPSRSGRRTSLSAELNLLAYAVATKKYVWSATVVASDAAGGAPALAVLVGVAPERVPLAVGTEFRPADAAAAPVADRLDTLARGALAELGYRLDSGRSPDVTVAAEVSKSVFDVSGGYSRFDGTAKVRASVAGAEPRLLGEEDIDARGLGDAAANRNLAEAIFERLSPWMKEKATPDAIGFEAVAFEVRFPGPVETAADLAPVEMFRKCITSMEGVRTFALVAQDAALNSATFRVAYEKARFPTGFVNALFTAHPELSKLLGE